MVADRPAPIPRIAGFPREARLTTPAEYEVCLRRPPVHRSGAFALHLCWVDASIRSSAVAVEMPAWRLGLVIPKRYEPSAVARNTIKRRWRDAFRRGRMAWAAEFGDADLVVRLQGPLVPKTKQPAKQPAGKPARRPGDATIKTVAWPARVRARDRFDASAMIAALADRLRSRGGRPAPIVPAGGPAR